MNNMYAYAQNSSLPSVFPYSVIFANYESLVQIRNELYLLLLLLVVCSFTSTLLPFISFRQSFLIAFHLLLLLTSTLSCLYLFRNLTFDFADTLWLYLVQILLLDALLHSSYHHDESKWKYNRVILALVISLILLYVYPIQSYIYQVMRDSLMYQLVIGFVLINVVLPSWHYLSQSMTSQEIRHRARKPTVTASDANESLTHAVEIKNATYDSNGHTVGSIQ